MARCVRWRKVHDPGADRVQAVTKLAVRRRDEVFTSLAYPLPRATPSPTLCLVLSLLYIVQSCLSDRLPLSYLSLWHVCVGARLRM